MFSKFFQKHVNQQPQSAQKEGLTPNDLDPRVTLHYGIPPTASILAFDPIQSILAVGTLDGRIKVLGGDNIEGLLTSPKPLPFKNLEFLHNQGFLVSISNDNEIQVWDLEHRYIGSEYGMVAVLKYDDEERKITQLPYYLTANVISELTGVELPNQLSVVGVLLQPCSSGNRVLISYESGLIVLWDVSEDRTVLVRGHKDLDLMASNMTNHLTDGRNELSTDISDLELEKEISSLCWVTSDGSILAVGYVDGDILFWNLSNVTSSKDQQVSPSPNNVVKLQLSSSNRRLPVIVLHWSPNELQNHGGKLFVYGGDDIGSTEVLTVLSLDWPSGIKSLKCIGRIDLTLNGSFADMVLSPNAGGTRSAATSLFVLANPGQLHVYDIAYLSSLMTQQKKICSDSGEQYPMVIPNTEPRLTTAKLGLVHRNGKLCRDLDEIVSAAKHRTQVSVDSKWPLTGGIPCQLCDAEGYHVERIYITGYADGSIRIWDATYPSFSLIFHLESEVKGLNISGSSAPISSLDFWSDTLTIAVGNECGVVRLYKFVRSSEEASLHYVTETKNGVHIRHEGEPIQCVAVFSLLNSSVCTLSFENCGAILAIGFDCGQVAVIDINTLGLLYLTNEVSNPRSPVISLATKSFVDTNNLNANAEESVHASSQGTMFIMSKNSDLVVLDNTTGEIISSRSIYAKELTLISMYIIEGNYLSSEASSGMHPRSTPTSSEENYSLPTHAHSVYTSHEAEPETSSLDLRIANLLILVCCETTLYLHSLKSMIEGDDKYLHKANLSRPCCWTTMLKKDGQESGLVVLYQIGVIEIRSLQSLEVVWESCMMSILRWNFKTNMDKTICSSDDGQIMLLNGTEFAVVSLLVHENIFRIPESLPCLHDKVLAAAVEATDNSSPSQHKRQGGILGSIVKGFKGGTMEHNVDGSENKVSGAHLERLFSSPPFMKPCKALTDQQDAVELDIDDIKIDEPVMLFSSKTSRREKKDEKPEKERLFEGASSDSKPKLRTAEEIRAKYRKAGGASAAASQARDKLLERQEKLDKLSDRTEELKNGAEDFADMAKELAKRMENRKWWQ